MFRIFSLFFLLSIPGTAQETQKRILFRGDSIWYAGENQLLFSSTNKGISWDTAFAKTNPLDTIFINGVLDTATNVFISDQRTLFVFGWDGTMHYKTILYSSSDCGKTWNKTSFYIFNGVVGVKYLHKISPTQFFLEGRGGFCYITDDLGKTWITRKLMDDNYTCADERFKFHENGQITYGFSFKPGCKQRIAVHSSDGGKTWVRMK